MKVRSGFDQAVAAQDKASVSRFAKLFYPLGIEQEGIDRFAVDFSKNKSSPALRAG